MHRILLLIKSKRYRRLMEDWLADDYQITLDGTDNPLEVPFDLAVIDGPALKRLKTKVRARRKEEEPVLLPFLLLTLRRQGTKPARHLGRTVDDLIFHPLNHDELIARVKNLIRLREYSLELKKEHDRVLKLSVTDDVSGFHNTRYLHRFLDRLLATPKARQEQVSLVFFDLDNFKQVVDAHGHLIGSRALKEVAQLVHDVLDEDDRLVRYGGDEFIVILPRANKYEALVKVEKMKNAINAASFLNRENLDLRLTASFGLATFPHDAKDKRELLAAADSCLFQSKSSGKNQISASSLEVHPLNVAA